MERNSEKNLYIYVRYMIEGVIGPKDLDKTVLFSPRYQVDKGGAEEHI